MLEDQNDGVRCGITGVKSMQLDLYVTRLHFFYYIHLESRMAWRCDPWLCMLHPMMSACSLPINYGRGPLRLYCLACLTNHLMLPLRRRGQKYLFKVFLRTFGCDQPDLRFFNSMQWNNRDWERGATGSLSGFIFPLSEER